MDPILFTIMMIGIGAMIGGVTNSLAIRMLFRPYRPVYIGKFQIPFTPGLIPKRQSELAKQLGEMVVEHLVTPSGLRNKLLNETFRETLLRGTRKEVNRFLDSKITLGELISPMAPELTKENVHGELEKQLEKTISGWLDRRKDVKIKDIVPGEWEERGIFLTKRASIYVQRKIASYLESPDGRYRVKALINDYFEKHGMFGQLMSSIFSSRNISERLHGTMVRYANKEETRQWIEDVMVEEYKHLIALKVEDIEQHIRREEIIASFSEALSSLVPLERYWDKPLSEIPTPVRERITEDGVAFVVPKAIDFLSVQMESVIKHLHLEDIVKEQVEAFEVSRLEDLVLGISRREFKMITYLGAMLGGFVGLLQSGIVLLLGI
ncbi:hypothetical protein AAV35_009570 [Salimicrobium jeotgali]|uniref:Uncharacterized protein n=1 Tax=Salimicrobium jeotgali TaxID=1230341 RepID=K2FI01_9BACI|nr:DUF445 family protein [Salimicrobium jeotgali]AKG05026.1 hypothetical protein AAV35_009570 [Salimicrobium jeotgali]EKE30666.1 hypothetical protein MJ3_12585 [Salimicrobium jeotgali]MBM7696901.1 uncharacterized membrane protein YheB (UPF0754 family) [Salimicrobium jeotgali]